MIKAVLFDVDGVLIDSFEANFIFYQELFKKVGYKPPTLQEYKPFIHFTLDKIVKEVTKASDEEVQKMWQIGKESLDEIYPYDLIRPASHLAETVEKLQETYQLGIVTSRIKEHIFTIPALADIQKYFQIAVGYEDTTKHKPLPDPLLFASNKLQVKPQEAIYVGDAESDIAAGKAAGMHVIHFAKERSANSDFYVDTFKELIPLIAKIAV